MNPRSGMKGKPEDAAVSVRNQALVRREKNVDRKHAQATSVVFVLKMKVDRHAGRSLGLGAQTVHPVQPVGI